VCVETDMQAMHNPSRMAVIKNATKHVLDKINSCCPQCDTPGFGITNAKTGLTCSLCDAPAKSTLSFIYSCKKGKYNIKKIQIKNLWRP